MIENSEREMEDRLYEAAFVPDLWPDLLQLLANRIDARGAIVFGSTDIGHRHLVSPDVKDAMQCFLDEGWHLKNTRAEIGWRRGLHLLPRFVTEHDYFDDDAYERDEIYLGYFRKQDLGWSAGTVFHVPNGDSLTLSFEKSYQRGPVSAESLIFLDGIRPHIARSIMLGLRLAFERVRSAVETLDGLGIPAFAVNAFGKLMMVNQAFEKSPQFLTTRSGGRIAFVDKRANELFYNALSAQAVEVGVRSFPVFGSDENTKGIIHAVPVRRSARDLFGPSVVIGVISLPNRPETESSVLLLQGLFDFTPAEARIAQYLSNCLNSNQISMRENLSILTIRTHVKRVMSKIGCSDQNHAVFILSNILR